MSIRQFRSFQELGRALLGTFEVVEEARQDIETACFHRPQGVKKERDMHEKQEALERAVVVLRKKYLSANDLLHALNEGDFSSAEDGLRQTLYYFAHKWNEWEKQSQEITRDQEEIEERMRQILIHRSGNSRPLTQEQVEEVKHRREQRREIREKEIRR